MLPPSFAALSDLPARLGESPVYSPSEDAIWWVDIDGRKLIRTSLDGRTTAWSTPEIPGFVQIGRDTRPIVGMQSGIFAFDVEARSFAEIRPCPQAGTRFNDACVDAAGTLWAGTMDLANSDPVGVLYRVRGSRPMEPVLDGFLTINGLAVDERCRHLYVSDSHPTGRAVWAFDISDDGLPRNRRVFTRFDGLAGRPDGAALDSDGGYWIAGIGGSELYRFAPDGRLTTRVAVPFRSPTKLAFAGTNGATVVVTSRADDTHDGRMVACPAWVLGARGAAPGLCAVEAS